MQFNPKQKPELIVSTDECRKQLGFLHIYRDHPILQCDAVEACDGHRYVAVPITLEKGDVGEYISVRDWEAARAAWKSENNRLHRRLEKASLRLRKKWTVTCDGIIRPREDDEKIGEYPATRYVFPEYATKKTGDKKTEKAKKAEKPAAVTTFALDTASLNSLSEAIGYETYRPNACMTFYGDLQQLTMNTGNLGGCIGYGILMPMRQR